MSGRAGFGLIEVLVALVLLEVGLLGCAGMLVVAHRRMTAAERLHRTAQAAAGAADSLLAAGAAAAGEADLGDAVLVWAPGAGGMRLTARARAGAVLFEWWIPTAAGR